MRTLISFLILPFSFSVILIVAGAVVRWYGQRRWGVYVMGLGLASLLFFSSYWGAWLVSAPLERMYEPLLDPEANPAAYVVVLGGGYNPDEALPPTSRVNNTGMMRLVEGMRVRNILTDATLVLSGGSISYESSIASAYYGAYVALGQDTSNVVLHHTPLNTEQEAMAVRELAGSGPVILVTSASHMPRSAALFRGQGIEVIPAPADQQLRPHESWGLKHFTWGPDYLLQSHRAFHEYVGILWAKMRGKAGPRGS